MPVSALGRVSLWLLALGFVAVACKCARPETHAALEPPPKHVAPAANAQVSPAAAFAAGEPSRERMTLSDGRKVSVRRHFGSLDEAHQQPQALFLRGLAHRLYDEALFSVVLTPYFDRNHADHFHLDLARYRVDETRR
jgi:hypothetical protein